MAADWQNFTEMYLTQVNEYIAKRLGGVTVLIYLVPAYSDP